MTIEISGPAAQAPPVIWASPEALFHLGSALCDSCVKKRGKGGFATHGIASTTQWAQDNSPPYAWRSFPSADATFFTVTISGPSNKRYSPGNTDPVVPLAIGTYLVTDGINPGDPQSRSKNLKKETYWNEKSVEMERGSTTTWWSLGPPGIEDEMVYQCDSGLGTPSASDCTAINWQQLATQSDSLRIGPETIFFHVNTCYLAISAVVAIVLQWNQIQMAASALMNTCIQHPYQAAQGGRAYFVSGSQDSTRINKRQSTNLTGWNALPPHVNMTLFEQSESWTNSVEELKTCTWQAAANRRPIAPCTTT